MNKKTTKQPNKPLQAAPAVASTSASSRERSSSSSGVQRASGDDDGSVITRAFGMRRPMRSHPKSFIHGDCFRVTYRDDSGGNGWVARCPFHSSEAGKLCTRSMRIPPQSNLEDAELSVRKALRFWCNMFVDHIRLDIDQEQHRQMSRPYPTRNSKQVETPMAINISIMRMRRRHTDST